MDLPLGIAIGLLVGVVFFTAICITRAGSLAKAWWGMTIAGQATKDPTLEAKIQALIGSTTVVTSAPIVPPAPAKPNGEALRLLALLQAEARLLDFFMESWDGATPEQIASGAKLVHDQGAAVLLKYLAIEPVLTGTEGERVTVAAGFDPSAVRMIGNVTGQPPFTGELQHPGWRVKELKLPGVATGQDLFVLQPAEVQVA